MIRNSTLPILMCVCVIVLAAALLVPAPVSAQSGDYVLVASH